MRTYVALFTIFCVFVRSLDFDSFALLENGNLQLQQSCATEVWLWRISVWSSMYAYMTLTFPRLRGLASLLNFAKDHAYKKWPASPCLRSKLALKLAYPCDDGPSQRWSHSFHVSFPFLSCWESTRICRRVTATAWRWCIQSWKFDGLYQSYDSEACFH